MNVSDAVLARYDLAHRYVVSPDAVGLLRERYLQVGGVTDPGQVDQIAADLLSLVGAPRTTVAEQGMALEPGQFPEHAFGLGDVFGDEQIVSYTLETDDQGVVTVTPELVDHVQRGLEAFDRQLKRMAAGGSSGSSNPAVKTSDTGSGTDTAPPIWTLDGALTSAVSPVWKVPRPFHATWMTAELSTAGTSNTVLAFSVNDLSTSGTLVLGPGSTHAVIALDRACFTGDLVELVIEEAGAGAQKLTVTVIGAMV